MVTWLRTEAVTVEQNAPRNVIQKYNTESTAYASVYKNTLLRANTALSLASASQIISYT